MKLVCVLLVCSASTAAWADAEHDRIRNERSAANARLATQERECETRFIVAPCLDGARTENRATLSLLRQQELQLDEGQRRAIAEARRKAIAEKAEAQQARASESEAQPPRVRMRRDPQAVPTPSWREPDADATRAASAAATGAGRASNEQLSGKKFDARARAVGDHRESVERRNAQRAARGKVAAPLPAAAGSSAPR